MYKKKLTMDRLVEMGCCGCFGFAFARKSKMLARNSNRVSNHVSQEPLLDEETELEDDDNYSYNGEVTDGDHRDESEVISPSKCSENILLHRTQRGQICRQFPVKETHKLVRSQDEDGNKMINEYVREWKIGSGSYGKVVLYRSSIDKKHYAVKAFHKSYLSKQRVAPCETAMTDVLREVLIMKILQHPNIVNLIEVIDDPTTDHFYMVLEYVEGKLVCERSGPLGGIGMEKARKYLRDIVCGLMYLHAHNIVHGDIKPDNLLVTADGSCKIGDFSVSQVFEAIEDACFACLPSNNVCETWSVLLWDENDELRRSPGTPVFTAPECCLGITYCGKLADTWAVGVTLYYMVFGKYPFLGESLQDTYDKIVNTHLSLSDHMNPSLKNLIEGLLCKDPTDRMTLEAVSENVWFIGEDGPIQQYLCWCKRKNMKVEGSDMATKNSQENTDDSASLARPV